MSKQDILKEQGTFIVNDDIPESEAIYTCKAAIAMDEWAEIKTKALQERLDWQIKQCVGKDNELALAHQHIRLLMEEINEL